MHRFSHFVISCVLAISLIFELAHGAKKKQAPKPPLSEAGQKIEAYYVKQLESLKAELEGKLPKINKKNKAELEKALKAEAEERKKLKKIQADIAHLNWARNMFDRANNVKLTEVNKGIANCEEKKKNASSDDERMAAEKKLEAWNKKKEKVNKELGFFQKKIKTLSPKEPQYKKTLKAIEASYAKAKTQVATVTERIGVEKLLNSSSLDGNLAQYVVMAEATPYGLAEFAQKGKIQETLLSKLFSDKALLTQIALADGAKNNKTGKAMKIYNEIQNKSSKIKDGILQRLALAVALEHAVPIAQKNAIAKSDAPEFVDPIERYLYYEKAYLDGELDSAFEGLSVWDLRMVVCGEEPNEILTWGRETLENFRPDHVNQPNHGWRYVGVVSSDVKYGSGDNKYDRDELQFFQNILMNGGICGRRAFFGRFMLRAWGVPNIKRPSRGHAALARWTPKGWTVCLGPRWGSGKAGSYGRYWRDVDFLTTTQGRSSGKDFLRVKRAYWAGEVAGEKLSYGESDKNPSFWSRIALRNQRVIIEDLKAVTLAAVGANLGEADAEEKSTGKLKPNAEEKITYHRDNSISIPSAMHIPLSNDILSMKSISGGHQIFLPRFFPQGKTIMRGGAWKSSENASSSGSRLLSDGRGVYEDWGLRAAMSFTGKNAPANMKLDLGNGVIMEMVYIKPGKFIMGGLNDKDGRFKCVELPKHKVEITKGFYLGKYEVTQSQYKALMGYNPSRSSKGSDYPVDSIPHADAVKFCEMVASKTGKSVRLPTEAEWEFACRAGSSTKWFFGDNASSLAEYAWYGSNAKKKSHPVGKKKPNKWGLYDMYGNVCERIADVYVSNFYAKSPVKDPFCSGQSDKSVFKIKVNAALAGTYHLTAKVVTVNYDQRIMVNTNGSESATVLNLPFTCGEWQDSQPIKIELKKGENVLKFWRNKPPQRGVSVKSFELKLAAK